MMPLHADIGSTTSTQTGQGAKAGRKFARATEDGAPPRGSHARRRRPAPAVPANVIFATAIVRTARVQVRVRVAATSTSRMASTEDFTDRPQMEEQEPGTEAGIPAPARHRDTQFQEWPSFRRRLQPVSDAKATCRKVRLLEWMSRGSRSPCAAYRMLTTTGRTTPGWRIERKIWPGSPASDWGDDQGERDRDKQAGSSSRLLVEHPAHQRRRPRPGPAPASRAVRRSGESQRTASRVRSPLSCAS